MFGSFTIIQVYGRAPTFMSQLKKLSAFSDTLTFNANDLSSVESEAILSKSQLGCL